MISWIDDKVAIGNLEDSVNYEMLVEEGISEVVDVRVGFNYNIRQDTMTLRYDLLFAIVNYVINSDCKMLIHCHAGMDRAPMVGMMYLAKKYRMSPPEAYDKIKKVRPITMEHWEWVVLLYEEDERRYVTDELWDEMNTNQKLDLLRNELQNILADLEYEDVTFPTIKVGKNRLAV